MDLIEVDNLSLRWMVPKTYGRPSLDVRRIGELVDLISSTGEGHPGGVYEYFLGWCASAGAKGRGEFYTHQSVDKLLVEMLEPMNRRLYDGCCGSGGVVVQAKRFVDVHGGQRRAAAHIGLEPSRLSQPASYAGPGLVHTPVPALVLRRAGLGPHTCPSSSASYAGPGLVHSSKTNTTVTYTVNAPEQG